MTYSKQLKAYEDGGLLPRGCDADLTMFAAVIAKRFEELQEDEVLDFLSV